MYGKRFHFTGIIHSNFITEQLLHHMQCLVNNSNMGNVVITSVHEVLTKDVIAETKHNLESYAENNDLHPHDKQIILRALGVLKE